MEQVQAVMSEFHMWRTTAREWQNTDQEREENDPKMRQQTNLQVFFYAVCLRQRVRVVVTLTRRHYIKISSCVY